MFVVPPLSGQMTWSRVLSFADNNYLQQAARRRRQEAPVVRVHAGILPSEGTTRDNSLEKMPFSDVVRRLAPDLSPSSHFIPPRRSRRPICCSWCIGGVTSRKQNMDEMLARTGSEHQQMVTTLKDAKQASDNAATNGGVSYSEAIGMRTLSSGARSDLDFDVLETAHEQSDAAMGRASNARSPGAERRIETEKDGQSLEHNRRRHRPAPCSTRNVTLSSWWRTIARRC